MLDDLSDLTRRFLHLKSEGEKSLRILGADALGKKHDFRPSEIVRAGVRYARDYDALRAAEARFRELVQKKYYSNKIYLHAQLRDGAYWFAGRHIGNIQVFSGGGPIRWCLYCPTFGPSGDANDVDGAIASLEQNFIQRALVRC